MAATLLASLQTAQSWGATVIRGVVSDGDCGDPVLRPEEAFFSVNMSHVEVELGPGAYGVNVLAEESVYGAGIGYVRVDSKDQMLLL